ncbi:MAG TPA: APC family permease [Gaiellaceae bacterium]|nr:APC family permease [Gaiellaceae bacterium]
MTDERELEELGYKQELPRVLRLWTNWAIGFAFISPIVGLYTVVALGATTAGPAWVWTLPIVVGGQLLVALVYAMLATRWPIAGGIYQWSRRLIGPKYGWWAGWIYMWALVITLSTVAYAGGGFLGQLVGVESPNTGQSILLALGMMAITTIVNVVGLQLLRYTVNIGIACEAIASVGIAIALIFFFREQPASVLTDTGGVAGGGSYFPAFLAAVAIAGWVILGFDACGSVAEETRDARHQVPKAIVLSILCVGLVDILAAVALVLATPDLGAVVSGAVADPVSGAVVAGLGGWAEKPFLIVVVTSFIACGVAVQGATVRVIYSYSRDGMLPLSRVWRRVSPLNHSPIYATLLVAALSSLAFVYANALSVLVAFATGAYYVGFLCPVGAALYLRLRGRWRDMPGSFVLRGRLGAAVTVAAAVWLVFELVNIAWPRYTDLPWWQNWAFPIGMAVFGLVGLAYFLQGRPDWQFTPTPAPALAARPAEEAPAGVADRGTREATL